MNLRLQVLLAIVTATVIGYLQASNLAHILTDSLPFKEMRFPPASLYTSAAHVIVWLGPISAAVAALVFGRHRTIRIAALLSVATAPIASWLVVAGRTLWVLAPAGYVNEAPDFSRAGALRDFAFWCAVAALLGVVLAVPTLFMRRVAVQTGRPTSR